MPIFGALAGAIIAFYLIVFFTSIFTLICKWIVYSKAGQPGWAVIIPVYNLIVFLKMVGRPLWWIVWYLQIIPFYIIFLSAAIQRSSNFSDGSVSPYFLITSILFSFSAITILVVSIILANGLSKSFGKSEGFTVGLIFLAPIFYGILAFGSAKYIGPGGVASAEADKSSPL